MTDEGTVRKRLSDLAARGATAVKFSTEDEGLGPEALLVRLALVGDLLPVHLKVGGPDARADIAFAARQDLAGVVAPMVESPYAARNFARAVDATPGGERLAMGINLETTTAVSHAEEILAASPSRISSVVVGRSDLAASLDATPDDEVVWHAASAAVRAARSTGREVALGGAVTPRSAREILERLAPDRIETRNVVFRAEAAPEGIAAALELEILFLAMDVSAGRVPSEVGRARIEALRERMRDA